MLKLLLLLLLLLLLPMRTAAASTAVDGDGNVDDHGGEKTIFQRIAGSDQQYCRSYL